jgi:UDP-2,3-diacylglucosamine pyrophosphatase LpxH
MPEARGYLVLSDFHLGEGRDPATGRVSPREDFFFDHEFSVFVDAYLDETVWGGLQWTLILNGDLMDFLQVTDAPATGEWRADPRYGLKAGRRESCWKLRRIADGHEEFFDALARFAARFPVVIIAGNHDVELTYPEVQQTLREVVCSRLSPPQAEAAARHLQIKDWFHFDGLVYVEHGHRFDSLNSFLYPLDPRLPHIRGRSEEDLDDVELPLGSLFVRYLFNQVETASPFADNIKPATRFIRWFVFRHPWRALHFFFSDGREMMRRIRRNSRRLPARAYRSREESHNRRREILVEEVRGRLGMEPDAARILLAELESLTVPPLLRERRTWKWALARFLMGPYRTPLVGAAVLAVLVLGLLLAVAPLVLPEGLRTLVGALPGWTAAGAEVVRWFFLLESAGLAAWYLGGFRRSRQEERECLRRCARQIQRITGARFVLMGHTHDPDLWRLDTGAEYFNSGTWTRVFGEDWVLSQEKELNYVQIEPRGGQWKGRLMKWEPQAGRGRLAYLFKEPGGRSTP